MRDPFWKWFAPSIAVLAIVLTILVLALLGHGELVAYPLGIIVQFLLPLVMLALYVGVPLFLIIAAWRWATALLREQRAIRRRLDEIAEALEKPYQPR